MKLLDENTTDRLRTKHIRTLELLQKTIDENTTLRTYLSTIKKQNRYPIDPCLNSSDIVENDKTDKSIEPNNAALVVLEQQYQQEREQLLQLLNTLHKEKEEYQIEIKQLKACIKKHEKHEKKMITKQNELQQEIQALSQCKSQKTEVLALHENILKLKLELKAKKKQIEKDEQQNISHQLDLRNQQQKIVEMENENSRLRQELSEFQHKEQLSKLSNIKLSAENDQINNRCEDLLGQLKEKENNYARMISELKAQVSKMISKEDHEHRIQSIVKENQIVDELQQQNITLKDRLKQVEAHYTKTLSQTKQFEHNERQQFSNLTTFAAHITLKRENYELRQQIEELKSLQRKFLSHGHKKTMSFPRL